MAEVRPSAEGPGSGRWQALKPLVELDEQRWAVFRHTTRAHQVAGMTALWLERLQQERVIKSLAAWGMVLREDVDSGKKGD